MDPRVGALLIDRGADVNAQDDDGDTPLHWASLYDSPRLFRLLVDRGADITTRNKKGQTAHDIQAEDGPDGDCDEDDEEVVYDPDTLEPI